MSNLSVYFGDTSKPVYEGGNLNDFIRNIKKNFKNIKGGFCIYYLDDENDRIIIKNDADYKKMLSLTDVELRIAETGEDPEEKSIKIKNNPTYGNTSKPTPMGNDLIEDEKVGTNLKIIEEPNSIFLGKDLKNGMHFKRNTSEKKQRNSMPEKAPSNELSGKGPSKELPGKPKSCPICAGGRKSLCKICCGTGEVSNEVHACLEKFIEETKKSAYKYYQRQINQLNLRIKRLESLNDKLKSDAKDSIRSAPDGESTLNELYGSNTHSSMSFRDNIIKEAVYKVGTIHILLYVLKGSLHVSCWLQH